MKKHTVVVILLDAFRWDFLTEEDTPTLYRMAAEGIYIKQLETSPGFSQDRSVLTGAPPAQTGYFSKYIFNPPGSPLKVFRHMKPVLSLLDANKTISKIFRKRILRPLLSKKQLYPYTGSIPLVFLPCFSYGGNNEEIRDIIKIGSDHHITINNMFPPYFIGDDDNTLREFTVRSRNKNDLSLLQFWGVDSVCHKSGLHTKELKEAVRTLDNRIKTIINEMDKRQTDYTIMIFSDHGISPVTQSVDIMGFIEKKLSGTTIKFGKDYFIFLDSTMARIWFMNERAKIKVTECMNDPALGKFGMVVDKESAGKKGIPYQQRNHGDLLWWANKGVLISPDYFNSGERVVKAMHGYDPALSEMKGLCVIHGHGIKRPELIERAIIYDLCPTICDLLHLPYPEVNIGRSLLG